MIEDGDTYGRYIGSLQAESSSRGSSKSGSESHTHWGCQSQKDRTNKLTTRTDLPKNHLAEALNKYTQL